MTMPDGGQQPGQQSAAPSMQSMPGMTMNTKPATFIEAIEQHATSGTSAEPNSTPMPMLMVTKGGWMFMFHSVVFVNGQQQTGPRGADKVFSTNWFMPMAQHKLGPGLFTARTMLSLEPATVSGRYLSGAVSTGRNRLWQADRRRPASAQFCNGARGAV